MTRQDAGLVAGTGVAALLTGAVGAVTHQWWAAGIFLPLGLSALTSVWVWTRRLPQQDPVPSTAELDAYYEALRTIPGRLSRNAGTCDTGRTRRRRGHR